MEQQNNKTKNWLSRLRWLKIRRHSSIERSGDEPVQFRHYSSDASGSAGDRRTRNTFRRSIVKMHNRMINCVMRNKTRHAVPVVVESHSPNIPSIITLTTPISHAENIYSLDPVLGNAENYVDARRTESSVISAPPTPERSRLSAPPAISTPPPITPRSPARLGSNARVPTDEIQSLSNCYWYWGPLTRREAEDRLNHSPDGAFLIRDSSSTSYLFTISFRSVGKTLHCRIEYNRGRYSLFDQRGYESIAELIEKAVEISENGIYCYSRNRDDNYPNFPVRLTKPLSRYVSVRSLKYLCRFAIRQCTNINDIPKLPLPSSVKKYLVQEGPYF